MFCRLYDPIVDGVGRTQPKLTVVHFDLSTPRGKEAQGRFGFSGAMPGTYIFDPAGKPLGRFHGAATEDTLAKLLRPHGLWDDAAAAAPRPPASGHGPGDGHGHGPHDGHGHP